MGKVIIPKQFSLMGLSYSVEYNDDILRVDDLQGQHSPRELKIKLKKEDDYMHRCQVEHNYFHELVHAILCTLCEDELNGNEKFVENFAGLLYQSLKTQEGEL